MNLHDEQWCRDLLRRSDTCLEKLQVKNLAAYGVCAKGNGFVGVDVLAGFRAGGEGSWHRLDLGICAEPLGRRIDCALSLTVRECLRSCVVGLGVILNYEGC